MKIKICMSEHAHRLINLFTEERNVSIGSRPISSNELSGEILLEFLSERDWHS